jgi:hypothetical protein
MFVLSACEKNGKVLTYAVNGTEVVINNCNVHATDAELAEDFTAIVRRGYTVTSIGALAFFDCSGLTNVNIPDTVTSIGVGTFLGCSGLTNVDIPVGVTSISNRMFEGCTGLTNINIPDSVTSIGFSAFSGCLGLTSIKIPDGVTSIGRYAFSRCASLKSIDIPVGVTNIGDHAFLLTTALTSIAVDPANAYFASDAYGVLFDNAQTALIRYPVANTRNYYAIPAGVTSIYDFAFSYCTGLTNINIPDSVTSIGDSAFSYCTTLTSANIPPGVTRIAEGAFLGCSGLTSANIPDGITNIEDSVFSYCISLKNINIPDSVTSIGKSAFSYCTGLKNINIPEGMTSIGDRAFSGSGIEEIRIPASITTIMCNLYSGRSPFSDMLDLDVIVFSHNRTNIPAYSLKGTFPKPVYVYIPNSVTSVDSTAIDPANKHNLIFRGITGGYIEEWASDNRIDFESIQSRITKDAYEAWRSVPYQVIIETDTPDNAYLSFELVNGIPPAGLTLSEDGRLSGVPLETGVFTFEVAVYFSMFGNEKEYPMDLQKIKLTVNEPYAIADNDASTYARLGERLSPHTFSYTSDGDVISKEQATDLAVDMLISEIPTLEKILLTHDDYFGDDYYGYKVNSWYMSNGDYGPDTYIEERVACIRPRGDELIDGIFYNVEYYEYIDDESGTRMPIILSFAVLVNKKVIIEDYDLNDEAAAEFEMYTKDTESKSEMISEPKFERDAD